MTGIADLTSGELHRLYRRRSLSPVEVATDVLARIARCKAYNAFLPLDEVAVLGEARASEQRWQAGRPLGMADGLPLTVKDNIAARGYATRKGSLTTDTAAADDDSPSVARLREQGAVVIGKTTMPEHGWIGSCFSPLTGVTRNPWDISRSPGGSTGGGAVAALLNLGTCHLGTDGAGSLRIPAAFSGVVGMKPSFGMVPVYPPSPLGVLSHQGPIGRTVSDVALVLSAIASADARDTTPWLPPAEHLRDTLEEGVRGLTIALAFGFEGDARVDPEIRAAVAKAARLLAEQGAEIEEITPPLHGAGDMIRPMWWSVAASIADAVPESERGRLDPGFAATAEQGRRLSGADFVRAFNGRGELQRAMTAFHRQFDILLTPTMPITAPPAEAVTPDADRFGDDWLNWSPFTYPFNLTQQPACSVPCGLSSGGLPIGLQIVGPVRGDARVLRVARAVERAISLPPPPATGVTE